MKIKLDILQRVWYGTDNRSHDGKSETRPESSYAVKYRRALLSKLLLLSGFFFGGQNNAKWYTKKNKNRGWGSIQSMY